MPTQEQINAQQEQNVNDGWSHVQYFVTTYQGAISGWFQAMAQLVLEIPQ